MTSRLAAGMLTAACVLFGMQADAQEQAPSPGFRELLADEGLIEPLEAEFENWQPPLSAEQASLAARILFRLQQIENGQLHAAVEPLAHDAAATDVGALVSVEGLANSAERMAGSAEGDQPPLWRVTINSADGPVSILSRDVPRAWRQQKRGEVFMDRVRAVGVLAGFAGEGDHREPLLLANRIAWFPASGVNSGVAWLVRQGLDAALLDAVQHGRAFAKDDEGREARAFYATLAAVAQGDAAELLQLARTSIGEEVASWKLRAATDQPSQRKQTMAAQVERRAAQGVSSAWPLFLDPEDRVGQPVLLEGTARRAVKVLVTDGLPELASYYELDVFTADSQNQPVICCVARLPVGFPTGEAIREPVRVAGVFFKKWAYARRADPPGDEDSPLPRRLAPPLVIAAEPVWLRTGPRANHVRELWIGAAIAAVVVGTWITLARISRRDRLARSHRARYDESLDALDERR